MKEVNVKEGGGELTQLEVSVGGVWSVFCGAWAKVRPGLRSCATCCAVPGRPAHEWGWRQCAATRGHLWTTPWSRECG
jgi:hypothetical protein